MIKTVFSVALAGLLLNGCAKPKDDSTTTQPTYGNICPAGTNNREFTTAQNGTGDPGGYIENATGTTISSISFRNVFPISGTYASFTFRINLYSCTFTGSSLGTTTTTVSNFGVGQYRTVTFTFSPAITIPTNCSSGKKTVAFKVSTVTTMSNGDDISADVGAFDATTCPTQNTTSTTSGLGTAESGKAWSTTVVAQ